jgi:hypothetical protein
MKSVLQDRLQTETLTGPNGSPDNGRFRAGSARAFFTGTTPTATPGTDALGSTTLDDGRLWSDSGNRNRLWVRNQSGTTAWEQCNAGAGVIKVASETSTSATYATAGWRDVCAVTFTTPTAFNSAAWQIVIDAKFQGYHATATADNITARIYDGTSALDEAADFSPAIANAMTVLRPGTVITSPTANNAYTFTLQVNPALLTWTQGYPAGTTSGGSAGGTSWIRVWFAPVATS